MRFLKCAAMMLIVAATNVGAADGLLPNPER